MKNTFFTAIILLWLPSALLAEDVLSVLGADGVVIEAYTMDELDALEQTTYVTGNAFMDAPAEFSGPRLKLVLTDAGYELSEDETVKLTAINGYQVDMPMADALEYDVILATRRDERLMSIREKGPIWIIYPIADHEELEDDRYSGRLVWQLKSIQVIE